MIYVKETCRLIVYRMYTPARPKRLRLYMTEVVNRCSFPITHFSIRALWVSALASSTIRSGNSESEYECLYRASRRNDKVFGVDG